MIDIDVLRESGWKQGSLRILVIRTADEETPIFDEVRDRLYECLRPGDRMRWNGYSLYIKFYDGMGSAEFDSWLSELRYQEKVERDRWEWWDGFTNGRPVEK